MLEFIHVHVFCILKEAMTEYTQPLIFTCKE